MALVKLNNTHRQLAKQVKELRESYKIARIIVMDGRFVHDVGEFTIEDAFVKTGNFASHIVKFLARSADIAATFEVQGVEERNYHQGD